MSKKSENQNIPFSVLMSVYKNDKANDLRDSIYSISKQQTLKPEDIVLVVDGPVPDELESLINVLKSEIPYMRAVWLPINKGLGNAMQLGLLECKNELVARMDSDDIACPNRFEKQLKYLMENPDVGIVGGQIEEFIDEPSNIVGKRYVPTTDKDLKDYLKSRCPFNHMTVMFKKSEVLKAGNYQDWHFNEDYFLWIRMEQNGCVFANLPDTLVNVRVGKDMYARRGGSKYFKSEEGIQRYMLRNNIISLPRYLFNTIVRFVIQVTMPNKLRGWIFRKVFRD